MFSTGLKRPITDDDTHNVLRTMHSDSNTEQLMQLWELEKKRRKPNLLRAVMNLNGYKMTLAGFAFAVMDAVARYVQPMSIISLRLSRVFRILFYCSGVLLLCFHSSFSLIFG